MAEQTATPLKVQRAVIPWSRPEGLPPLGEHDGPGAFVVPAVPVALLNLDAGRALNVRPQLDTGCDETVFSMRVAEQLGLGPGELTPDGKFDLPLKNATRDVFACRLEAVIAGRWQVAMTRSLRACSRSSRAAVVLLCAQRLGRKDGPALDMSVAVEPFGWAGGSVRARWSGLAPRAPSPRRVQAVDPPDGVA